MNRVFRIVWSYALHAWVVASELSTRRGKRNGTVDKRVTGTDAVGAGDGCDTLSCAQPWPLRLSILMALLMAGMPAGAADRYWDPNGTILGNGGAGTWDTSGVLWSPNNDGTSGPYSFWNNAPHDDAFFGGTAGTVTLGGPMTVHNITFQTDGYSLTGGSLILGGTSPTLSVTTGTSTIASPITSTSGLIKAGAGTLMLSGSNSFGGGVDVNGGTLSLNAANSFNGAINVTGGNLTLGGTIGDVALGGVGNQINLGSGRTLTSTGALSASRTVNLVSGTANIRGSGTGSAFYTGAGGLDVGNGIALTNDANNYTGRTSFTAISGDWNPTYNAFSSIADLGVASALGAPTTVANGTIVFGPGCCQALNNERLHYTGTGHSSNRNWEFRPGNYGGGAFLFNSGSGTLRLTGNISGTTGSNPIGFVAESADMELLGVISSTTGRSVQFNSGSGRTIRLGTANTFSGQAQIVGGGKTEAALISDAGVAGSLGTGSISISSSGTLEYIGAGESSTKNWTIDSGTLNSSGAGALTLGGTVAITNTATLGGSFTGASNTV